MMGEGTPRLGTEGDEESRYNSRKGRPSKLLEAAAVALTPSMALPSFSSFTKATFPGLELPLS